MFFFFFFQAEDGIRDIGVTGVQTCALPISFRSRSRWRLPSIPSPCSALPARGMVMCLRLRRMVRLDCFSVARWLRSEERRVGKSVDLGGRRIIKKKKNNHPARQNTKQ